MKQQSNQQGWTTVIKPRNGLFEVNLKEIWDYRDLLTLFVKRRITVTYKQTILGPLWWFIQPAFTVIMYNPIVYAEFVLLIYLFVLQINVYTMQVRVFRRPGLHIGDGEMEMVGLFANIIEMNIHRFP